MPEGLGVETSFEDPSGQALRRFHDALARADRGDGQARVVFYGASHTACDHYVGFLRAALQERFGDAGRGFALAAYPKQAHYWQWGVAIDEGRGWTKLRLGRSRGVADHYGLAGMIYDSEGREAWSRITTSSWGAGQRADRVEVLYQRQPGGGDVEVLVDGQVLEVVSTAGPIGAGSARFEVADAPHVVELHARAGAPVRVYGVVLERDVPGVVVDNLAQSGSRVRYHLKWREPVYGDQLRARRPDLVVLAYGGNEGNDFDIPIATYERRLDRALSKLRRAVPDASCALLGPADKPRLEAETGRWIHRERTTAINDAQRRAAFAHGCAFFDTVAFMGGPLSMLRWHDAEPPLARDDRVHFSALGYRRYGEVLLHALLEDWSGPEDD